MSIWGISKSKDQSENQKNWIKEFFKGKLSTAYFCAKANDEYHLYTRLVNTKEFINPAVDSISGWKSNDDLTREKATCSFKKGEFYEIRDQMYASPLAFRKGAKVLSLKPTENNLFTVRFYPATVVSEAKACQREFVQSPGKILINKLNVRTDKTRRQYEVMFDDDQSKTCLVYEELIVPLEKDWGNIKDIYPEERIDSDSSEEEEDSEESNEKKHHKHHKHHSHSKRSKNHKAKSPKVIIIPIVIPYGNYQLQYPYFY